MYKKLLATSGIVSSLLFTGGATTFAQTGTTTNDSNHPTKGWHGGMMHKELTPAFLAEKFGLNVDEIKQELAAGKTMPEILQAHGITPEKMHETFGNMPHPMHQNMQKHLDAALDTLAPKLGLNADEVRTELKAGKTFKQILDEHGITKDKMQSIFGGFRPHLEMKEQMSDTMLQIQASVLGLSIDQLKQDFANKQTMPQIAQAQGMTMDQFREKVITELQKQIDEGTVTGTTANMFKHMIDRMSRIFHP